MLKFNSCDNCLRYPRGDRGRLRAGPSTRRSLSWFHTLSENLSTKKDQRVGDRAAVNNVELAYTPTYSSWLNRIDAQFQALRYFTLDGTDHGTPAEQASMIRRYIRWRNRNAHDRALTALVKRAKVA